MWGKYLADSVLSFESNAFGGEPFAYTSDNNSFSNMDRLWELYKKYKDDKHLKDNFGDYYTELIGTIPGNSRKMIEVMPENSVKMIESAGNKPADVMDVADALMKAERGVYYTLMEKGVFIFPIDYRPELLPPVDDPDYNRVRDLTCVKATLDAAYLLGGKARISVFMGCTHEPPFKEFDVDSKVSPLYKSYVEELSKRLEMVDKLRDVIQGQG